ncbi:hypothetical protein MFIFM68171_00898 [Madurella fahalii]|uniref:Metallothionein n=1 Tax=Madurella fahalii TaxID=1157608 RepID=A0ABQ0FYX2_9PEZI
MPGDNSEKDGAGLITTLEKPVARPQPVNRKDNEDRHYICGCKNCICGGAVEYPGDICSICSKYH